jgi:uncharacterized protein YndB with AHSA1/START domain
MTVTNVSKDLEALTLTITCEFAAGVERVWQVWADPRQLERWWGPPTYPATVTDHDLVPGGRVSYYMTGPEGDTPGGWWRIIAVEEPHRLEFKDGFTDDDGEPNEDMPTTVTEVTLETIAGGATRMTMVSTFPSLEAMEQLMAMGAEEGMRLAVGQVDGLIEAGPA